MTKIDQKEPFKRVYWSDDNISRHDWLVCRQTEPKPSLSLLANLWWIELKKNSSGKKNALARIRTEVLRFRVSSANRYTTRGAWTFSNKKNGWAGIWTLDLPHAKRTLYRWATHHPTLLGLSSLFVCFPERRRREAQNSQKDIAALAKWLPRQPAKLLGFARAGSNPAGRVFFFSKKYSKKKKNCLFESEDDRPCGLVDKALDF